MQSDEESDRTRGEIENIKSSLKTIDDDADEKALLLMQIQMKKALKRKTMTEITLNIRDRKTIKSGLTNTKNILEEEIEKVKNLIKFDKKDEALVSLDNFKKVIENYSDSYSKNQSIKNESVKRNERIKIIEKEIESWKNLFINSEKMINELNERKLKLTNKLEELQKQPQSQAEKKGQISEGLRLSEKEKIENESFIDEIDNKIVNLRNELNTTKESSIEIRERKASSGATIEGLNKRRK